MNWYGYPFFGFGMLFWWLVFLIIGFLVYQDANKRGVNYSALTDGVSCFIHQHLPDGSLSLSGRGANVHRRNFGPSQPWATLRWQ